MFLKPQRGRISGLYEPTAIHNLETAVDKLCSISVWLVSVTKTLFGLLPDPSGDVFVHFRASNLVSDWCVWELVHLKVWAVEKWQAPTCLAGVLNLIVEGRSRDGNAVEGLCLAQHLSFVLKAGNGLEKTCVALLSWSRDAYACALSFLQSHTTATSQIQWEEMAPLVETVVGVRHVSHTAERPRVSGGFHLGLV